MNSDKTINIMSKPHLVISRCFLKPVRYNGGIINDLFINKLLSFVKYRDVCPEVDIGLGVPRPRVTILKINGEYRLVQPETGRDLTEVMNEYATKTINTLEKADGFVLKAKSPSCGVGSAKFNKAGPSPGKTDGLFATHILKAFPHLPVEDEGRLRDYEIRRHFLIRIYSFTELKELIDAPSPLKLIEFHTRYKYLLMTYNQKNLRLMGKIVASGDMDIKEKIIKYSELFYQSFAQKPTRKKHLNTLMHITGYFSREMGLRERRHLTELIDKYSKQKTELKIIIELLRSLAYRFENQYILIQKYLDPYPEELNV